MSEIIHRKLTESLAPSHLEVINESYLHRGHAGDNGKGDSHFRVKIASKALQGMSRVEAQRRIYSVLDTELKNGIHALSISVLADNS